MHQHRQRIFHLIITVQPTTAEQLELKIEIGFGKVQALSNRTLILHISFHVYHKVHRRCIRIHVNSIEPDCWLRRLS